MLLAQVRESRLSSVPIKRRCVVFRKMHCWLDLVKQIERSLKRNKFWLRGIKAAKIFNLVIESLDDFTDSISARSVSGLKPDRQNILVWTQCLRRSHEDFVWTARNNRSIGGLTNELHRFIAACLNCSPQRYVKVFHLRHRDANRSGCIKPSDWQVRPTIAIHAGMLKHSVLLELVRPPTVIEPN